VYALGALAAVILAISLAFGLRVGRSPWTKAYAAATLLVVLLVVLLGAGIAVTAVVWPAIIFAGALPNGGDASEAFYFGVGLFTILYALMIVGLQKLFRRFDTLGRMVSAPLTRIRAFNDRVLPRG